MKEEEDRKKRREREELEKRMVEDKLEALKKTPIGAKAFQDMKPEVRREGGISAYLLVKA